MNNKVTCAECGKQMMFINNKHLASHGLTAEEYQKKHPNCPTLCEELAAKLSARSVKSNESRKGIPRSEAVKQKMREAQAKLPPRQKRGPMSETQKQLLSHMAKERYQNGFVHPNTGNHLDESTRSKIAETLRGRKIGDAAARKAIETKRARGYDLAFFKGHRHSEETRKLIGKKSKDFQRAQRAAIREVMFPRFVEAKLDLLNAIDAEVFELRCQTC